MNSLIQKHSAFTLYQQINGLFVAVSPDGRTFRSEEEASAKLAAMNPSTYRLLRAIGSPDSALPFIPTV